MSTEKPSATYIRNGHNTPAQALTMIEQNDQYVALAPYHGGMAVRVPLDAFQAEFKEVDISTLYQLRKGRFSVEGGDSFDGYTTGRVWNGWACPMVTRDVAESVLAKCCDDDTLTFSQDLDTLCVVDSNYPDEPYEIKPITIEFEGQSLKLWDLSELGWCFYEDGEDSEG